MSPDTPTPGPASERTTRKVVKKWHLPRFYRYKVGSVSGKANVWKSPGPALRWNKYDYRDGQIPDVTGVVRIGVALIVGRYAYCIKWAASAIERRRRG